MDDFAAWRALARQFIARCPASIAIDEACDGLEAIEKAAEKASDIILLDIGMPRLNGIEAAKILHQKCPTAKIVFVTQFGDDDLRNTALQLEGAVAYVLKQNIARELVDVITVALNRR